MKTKALTVLSSVALIGSLLAGCGAPKQTETPSGQAAPNVSAIVPEKQLVVAGNGATVETMMKDEIFKKFNEKYPDVKLTYVSGVSTELVAKAKASKASPQFDVAIVEGGEQETGRKEGLWETVTDKEIPNIKNVLPDLKVNENSGVAVNYTPMGISYNTALIKEKNLPIPKSWNDLTKPEMKNNITISEISSNFGRSTTIMLAYANGGSEKKMDPGFEKLATIAGYMPTFAKSAAQLQQNLQNKSAVYTTWTMARSIVQKDVGLDLAFVVPEEGTNLVPNVATLVKNAKSPNAAKLFIDFLLTDEVQNLYATKLYYNPATSAKLPDETAKLLEFDRSKIVNFDYNVLSAETPNWLDRFNKEIAPKVGK